MLRRNLLPAITAALADRPVVLLHGPRQTGKSTLATAAAPSARYLTFDDLTLVGAAAADPRGFLDGLADSAPVILDEVQRVPDLFPAIKAIVDRDRTPGRFLLTGSANIYLVPRISESLAGRMEVATLLPLSQGEIEGHHESFISAIFARRLSLAPKALSPSPRATPLAERIVRGGYPELVTRIARARRDAWFASYITAILGRDVRDLANIEDLAMLPRLLALVASRTSGLLNFADLSRSITLPQSTLKRYFSLLQATFMIHLVPPWSANIGLRLVKSPKVFLGDTGLAAHLLAASPARLKREPALLGPLLENFVVTELLKQLSWTAAAPSLYHFRTTTGREVDMVLEDRAGRIVGIEVKSAATITSDDLKGMRALAETAGTRFLRGIILYTGGEHIPFGKDLHALPLHTLWTA
jgi:uncharacterized protein